MTTVQRSDAIAVSRPAPQNVRFIAVLRGAAALLVVWDHLGATWPEYEGKTWAVVKYVREGINTPFGIIQDFGWLGVSIFFLVSGFIITHVAQRETRTSFGVKRAFRILPPLWASIGLILLLDWVLTVIHVAGSEGTFTFGQVLRSMVLLNYFLPSLATINGVGWTLAIEVVFYFLTFVFIGLVRKSPKTTLCVNLAIVMSVLLVRHGLGATGAYLVTDVSYIPILLLGQVMYFRWSGRGRKPDLRSFVCLGTFRVCLRSQRGNSSILCRPAILTVSLWSTRTPSLLELSSLMRMRNCRIRGQSSSTPNVATLYTSYTARSGSSCSMFCRHTCRSPSASSLRSRLRR